MPNGAFARCRLTFTRSAVPASISGMTTEQALSIVLSILALTNAELAGRKLRAAWVVGMVAQSGWVCFMFLTGNFGFSISIIGFTVIYIRNYRAWSVVPSKRAPQKR